MDQRTSDRFTGFMALKTWYVVWDTSLMRADRGRGIGHKGHGMNRGNAVTSSHVWLFVDKT